VKPLLLILLILPSFTWAQPSLLPKVADSLWNIWQDETQPDTARINAIHDYAWDGYLYTQPDSAFYYAQLQCNFAKTKGLKKQMANALNTQGISLSIQGDYDKAIDYFTRSLKIREEIGDKQDIAATLNNFGIIYKNQGDYAKAIDYNTRSLKIREEMGYKKGIATSLNNIGVIYDEQGDYAKAIDYYTRSLKILQEMGDKQGLAASLNNIGTIHKIKGDFAKAIDYHTRSLKIQEEMGNKKGIAASLNNIGIIYKDQGDYAKAIEYYTRSLRIRAEIGDKQDIADALNNIGTIHKNQGDYAKAIDYYTRSLKILEEMGDKQGIAASLNNIGITYKDQGDYVKAIDHYTRSLKIREEIGDKQGIATAFNSIGSIYKDKGDYAKALDYCGRALTLARELGAIIETRIAAQSLWVIYKKLGRFENALEMYELYITTRDSIESEENQKEIIRQEFKYDYETQAAADSVKHAEEQKVKDAQIAQQDAVAAQQEAELENKRIQQYALFGGLGLLVVFLGFVYNRFRVTNQQKKVIEIQKTEVEQQKQVVEQAHELLEEKNKEILDSINYAKRIQSAILPPQKLVKEYLPDSFILYKPKDIVAGDFYWMETAPHLSSPPSRGEMSEGQRGAVILFAAADCTGHGVPGAMVSVVCNNGLNRSVREHGLTDPGQILDKTRQIVISEFEKSEEEVKDGMDISLCSLTQSPLCVGEGLGLRAKLQWAGANNPLWIINPNRTEWPEGALPFGESLGGAEIKPDKQPIGKYADPKPFTTHSIDLQTGDTVYIFTDGYQDQFGGEKGKKFKAANFKQLLLSIQHETMERQRVIIDEAFEKWKEGFEQVDDVCVIGVRL
jgi:tetratricopeptide (TPR) repeat protein/serine phosphatase RsbU (regulator of sigma subunit)